jgi:hypothetical protein
MKTSYAVLLIALLAVAAFATGNRAHAQRSHLGKVTSLQATVDDGVLTCLNATSEAQNSKPVPSCHLVAPGFTGNLLKGQTANVTAAGTVTLTCNGQGPMLRCTARLDTPPLTK